MRWSWFVLASTACAGAGSDDGPPTDVADGDADTDADSDADADADTDADTDQPNLYTTGDAETCMVLFGGVDRVVTDDDDMPSGTVSRTLQGWIRTRSMADQVALSYGRPSPNQGLMLGTVDGKPTARAGTATNRVVGDTFVADDTWHHLAVVWDGHQAILVVDGVTDIAGPLDLDSVDGDVVAGNTPTGDDSAPWTGWLDDLRIFRGIRTVTSIAADLDGVNEDPQDLLLWWDFEGLPEDGGPGLTVPDLSGKGHDGTTGGSEERPLFPACR